MNDYDIIGRDYVERPPKFKAYLISEIKTVQGFPNSDNITLVKIDDEQEYRNTLNISGIKTANAGDYIMRHSFSMGYTVIPYSEFIEKFKEVEE